MIDTCRNDPDSGQGEKDDLLTNDFSRSFKIKRSRDHSSRPKVSATPYACNIGKKAYEWAEKGLGFSVIPVGGPKGKMANSQG